MSQREVKLPSGAILKISLAPFPEALALFEAILEEGKSLNLDPQAEVDVNLYKDLACVGFSSKKIKKALEVCMERTIYNETQLRASEIAKVFEQAEARQDYLQVCFEVAKENISPFTKSLYAELFRIVGSLKSAQA